MAVQKSRDKKAFEERLKLENPDLAKAMKLQDGPGKPSIETDNPGKIVDALPDCGFINYLCNFLF